MSDLARIVVINDDPVQLRLMSRVLEGGGFDVAGYLDSTEAIAALDAGRRVDLFVVDLHMPGIDGWKVCRLLRSPDYRAYNATPILIVSATFTGSDVEAITADLGADAFLALPFSRAELLEDVADLLEGRRPRKRLRALVLEDDDAVARAVRRAFEAHSYEVHRASTLAEASLLWTKLGPDVVVLDYHVPDGCGVDLLERLQSPAERTAVLFMTGDSDPELPLRLLELGADGIVRKPFDPAFLVELAGKARRERSLLRVEALLERRTQELRSSELRYRSLFEAIPDLVIALDASDRITGVNGSAVAALGCEVDDVLRRPVDEFVPAHQVEHIHAALARVRSQGRIRLETELARPGGPAMPVEVTAAHVEDAEESSVLVVARDVTERRQAEEERRRLDAQVQHAQRLDSLGVLAGGIAHDFNNLLVGVMGNASLALLDVQEGTSVHECITQIETAARRAAELTQQILTFSGKGDSVRSPQDLSSVVSEMGQLLAPAVSKKAVLNYRLERKLPLVKGDPSQLRQVIMNLIMNASDALCGDAGTIEASTGLETLDAGQARLHYLGERAKAGRYVVLEVVDDGCGMDEATKRQIFDPFFTTKFAGRGLGLAATLGIVRAHGGLLSVDSAPGEGTTFRVLLPALGRGARDPGPGPFETASPWAAGGSILVIDDEPSVRQLATATLSRAGFGVVEAGDGLSGLDLLEGGPVADLVVVDVTMPGMSGLEVLETIRAEHPRLPVVLSSGFPADTLPSEILDGVTTSFLRKPYAPGELLTCIYQLLSAARSEAPARPPRERARAR
jgi:PAS domain S-box-containing protein